MDNKDTALRKLLAGELPLDRVGPQLRDAARRALRAGDEDRMFQAAKAATGELLRSGELLRVAVDAGEGSAPCGPFCLLKGTTRLIDLSVLGGREVRLDPSQPWVQRAPAPDSGESLSDLDGSLDLVEASQALVAGESGSGGDDFILWSILELVSGFTPQFQLFIQLATETDSPESGTGDFLTAEDGVVARIQSLDGATGWQQARPAGHSVWIPAESELPANIRAAIAESTHGNGCAAVVPLWAPGGPDSAHGDANEAGLLYVATGEDWGRESMLRVAERLSRFVTSRWQKLQDVNLRIHRDALTGAYNRAYFDIQFPRELERARRSNEPLTLIEFDLDQFKEVNDGAGHQAGDRVLMMVVRRLQEELRRIDHICRVGGDEFVLILPDTSQAAGQEVMGRLLETRFSETAVEGQEKTRIEVTFSSGAVTFPAAGNDPYELYRKADAMLYMSKDMGRNQCHFWSSTGDHVRLTPGGSGD